MTDKQKYEAVLKLFEQPKTINEVSENFAQYLFNNKMVNIFTRLKIVEKTKGINAEGRKSNFYKSLYKKLSASQVTQVKAESTFMNRDKKNREVKSPIQYSSISELRQKMLDLFKDGDSACNVFAKVRTETRNMFNFNLRVLKRDGYIEDVSINKFKRFKTIKPLYVHKFDKKEKRHIEKLTKSQDVVYSNEYINGVLVHSADRKHWTKTSMKSPKNYVSGSTLSWAL